MDFNDVGSRAPDIGAHGVEEVGQVHDMGLLGGVFDDGHAVGQGGGQHNVHGGPHRDDVQIDLPPGQAAPPGDPGVDQAVAHVHLGPHGHEALDVLVHGPAAQVAAAGQGDLGPAEPAEQRPHKVIAGSDLSGQLVGDLAVADVGAVHLHRGPVDYPHVGPQLPEDLEDQRHIADLGDVLNAADAVHQQGGGNDRDGGVFGAADLDGSMEGVSPLNQILGQRMHPLFHVLESIV